MIKNIIKIFNSHFLNKKINVFSPASIDISNKAYIDVKTKFNINCNWSRKLTINNKVPCIIKFDDYSNIIVDKFLIYSGCNIRVRKDAKLILKSGYINHNCIIDCTQKIVIGNKVYIGENVIIRDSDNHSLTEENNIMTKEIEIEDNVWIGDNCIILKGVHIGQGSIIGAGSIVTKDVPSNCVAVGNPAKVIKRNVTWNK